MTEALYWFKDMEAHRVAAGLTEWRRRSELSQLELVRKGHKRSTPFSLEQLRDYEEGRSPCVLPEILSRICLTLNEAYPLVETRPTKKEKEEEWLAPEQWVCILENIRPAQPPPNPGDV